jgi:hypothetical protein
LKQIIIIAILAFSILAPVQAFAISNKPTQLIDNCGLGQGRSCITEVAANGTIIIIPGTPPPVQQPLIIDEVNGGYVTEEEETDEMEEDSSGDSTEVPRQSIGSNDNDDDNGNDGNGGRYTGECKGQQAPQYPDYCSDPKDTPEYIGQYDDDNDGGEEWDDSCRDLGYDDGQNGSFAQGTYDHCGDETGGDDAYFNGFIEGCMDAGNTRDVCEQATDAG